MNIVPPPPLTSSKRFSYVPCKNRLAHSVSLRSEERERERRERGEERERERGERGERGEGREERGGGEKV